MDGETSAMGSAVNTNPTRPAFVTSCTSTCSDCDGTAAIGPYSCDRRTQWLRRVGYPHLFAGRRAA